MRRLDRRAFAKAIALGMSQRDALVLAGSHSSTPGSASRTAGRLLRCPDVQRHLAHEKLVVQFGPVYGPLIATMDDEDLPARERLAAARIVYRRFPLL